ncbi:DUF4258 domain-containing protein [Candidatus Pacearchaeota archaeon]|nr:DUF4258 domain-containing protein [Candidatus Pacearchaeota archaeon]
MEVVYSDHAKKRMKQRGIEEWEVEHILKFPSYIKKSFSNRKVAVGELKNRAIKVVFIEIENYKKIISVV